MARLCEVRNRLGLRVPDGVVTTARASQLLLADPRLGPHLDALEAGGPATPALQETVAALPVPPEVDKALRRALANFDGNARFAVRSSAIGEDGVVSFAGQYETIRKSPATRFPRPGGGSRAACSPRGRSTTGSGTGSRARRPPWPWGAF